MTRPSRSVADQDPRHCSRARFGRYAELRLLRPGVRRIRRGGGRAWRTGDDPQPELSGVLTGPSRQRLSSGGETRRSHRRLQGLSRPQSRIRSRRSGARPSASRPAGRGQAICDGTPVHPQGLHHRLLGQHPVPRRHGRARRRYRSPPCRRAADELGPVGNRCRFAGRQCSECALARRAADHGRCVSRSETGDRGSGRATPSAVR